MTQTSETFVVERAQTLAAQGRVPEAFRMLTEASDAGSAPAALTLGQWRLSGDLIRRDLALCREYFGRAAALGLRQAEPIHLALLANGAGNIERHWPTVLKLLAQRAAQDDDAAVQLRMLQGMDLNQDGNPHHVPSARVLHDAPLIRAIPQFLSIGECAYLMQLAAPMLQPSVVVHPVSGTLVQDPVRTSSAAAFPFIMENPVLHAINRRIAAATDTSYAQGEPVQVLRYTPGQQYKLHSDALPGEPNQRFLTLLVYLNDDYQGGETQFPDADVLFKGAAGNALIFANVKADGLPDPSARHAGLPIRQGRKFLLSKWIRQAPLDLRGPPGRPF